MKFRIDLIGAAFAAALSGGGAAWSQPAACGDTTTFCSRSLAPQCLTRFGAGALDAADSEFAENCRVQLQEYGQCLALVSAQCVPEGGLPTPDAGGRGSSALEVWNEIKTVEDADVLEAFAKAYPASPLAVLAGKRAAALRKAASVGDAAPEIAATPSVEERAALEEEKKLRQAFVEGQRRLNRLGYDAGPEDGKWGRRSGRALERFLTDLGVAPSRILTPDALAALRSAPEDIRKRATAKAPGPEKPAKSGGLTAKVAVTFRFNDRSKKQCSLRRRTGSRALDLRRVRLSCRGKGTAYVTLRTDASGRSLAVKAELNGDIVSLNGTAWRYNGVRSAGRDPNEIRGAKIAVSF